MSQWTNSHFKELLVSMVEEYFAKQKGQRVPFAQQVAHELKKVAEEKHLRLPDKADEVCTLMQPCFCRYITHVNIIQKVMHWFHNHRPKKATEDTKEVPDRHRVTKWTLQKVIQECMGAL